MARCTHLDQIRPVTAASTGCEECLALGQRWVHLRECLSCGHVGCCDSSRGRHATKHHRSSGHPIAASVEPGESWAWCYVDEEVVGQ
ncbi:UBP-type zinc finger domain-containing protein [Sphaerisporangium fuscum]|uniref:UBP-type zinc finger domain-containing protein n=1 Tax=Sphaerisporangium fuscum TaxID=2835868 RepID=UPI0027E3406E|nr:UBP-type zinc finger domain-containing protein [Sphaerisporangium fuscum]